MSLALALVAGEWVYRKMLFGHNPAFEAIQKTHLYADPASEEYWLLDHWLSNGSGSTARPHPWLGWEGPFDFNSLLHNDYELARGKRPVLLYGDSYAMGVPGNENFQSIFNADTLFSRQHFLLNYGVGGYGLDQIQILMHQTAYRFRKPFVIFSFLTEDMDRSGLPLRIGVKPYYQLLGDSLALKGVPVTQTARQYAEQHPIGIRSYLMRRLAWTTHTDWVPEGIRAPFKGNKGLHEQKVALNRAILDKVLSELKAIDCDYLFVVFQAKGFAGVPDPSDDWRLRFLHEWFDSTQAPHIFMAPLIDQHARETKNPFDHYALKGNGHPTTACNMLMEKWMAQHILSAPFVLDTVPMPGDFEYAINRHIQEIRNDPKWLAKIQREADSLGSPLEARLNEHARYLLHIETPNFRW